MNKPLVGIGACLLGQPVRYNGDGKKKNRYIEALKDLVEYKSLCPELGIGLGVPRPIIRLVGDLSKERLTDSDTQSQNYRTELEQYTEKEITKLTGISGYILVKDSPSCGYQRVKRYDENGHMVGRDTQGILTQTLLKLDPLLPLEEDGRLNDPALRENFIQRVFAYHHWKSFLASKPTFSDLLDFWSSYKYQVMAHHIMSYRELGQMLSDATAQPFEDLLRQFGTQFMQALSHIPSRKSHVNVIDHMRGYLKNKLNKNEKRELQNLIEQYRSGIVPLIVPITLLKHFFMEHQHSYIERQVYLQPYPERLGLRNLI